METLGLFLFGLLFVFAAYGHIKNHTQIAGYAASGFGECPYAVQLGYLGGWPTGVFLLATGVGIALGSVAALYAAAGFLAVATGLYHRDYKDPGTFKNVALLGAALALASLV